MLDKKRDELKKHEYDGIHEYDNDLPRWWLWTFYVTIIFGVAYWLYYETTAVGRGQVDRLQAKVEEHRAAYQATAANAGDSASALDDHAALALMQDPAVLAQAQALFSSNCAACHGAAGQGVIGPNLTDSAWIHGGDAASIERTIKKGVVEKGMLAWETTLSSTQIRQLVGYILSLEGSHPANAKAAEGQIYERKGKV